MKRPSRQTRSAPPPGMVSLDRAISKLGWGSRGQAREWIATGKVSVRGRVADNPKLWVNPERDQIHVEGLASANRARHRVFLYHKPKGEICTRQDEQDRPTVVERFADQVGNWFTVGRLDLHTTGLLLVTNWNAFSEYLTNPKNEIARIYIVSCEGEFNLVGAENLRKLGFQEVVILKASGKESTVRVTLTEGKNREVRRGFAESGHAVRKLKRIQFGALHLGDLALGERKEISLEEIHALFPGFSGSPSLT